MPRVPAPPAATPAPGRAPDGPPRTGAGALAALTLALFLVWSNTFLAFEVLLAPKRGAAPMGWLDLVVARFVPVVLVCACWCFGLHRRESLEILRRHPVRLALCGLLAVPTYNGCLYFAMAHRVSGPIASLLTTLSPLYLVLIGALTLGERIGRRQVAGLAVGLTGVVLVATSKGGGGGYGWSVALLSLAPLAWSGYTALTKPVTRTVSPLLWTYLVLVVGGAPLLFLLPFHGGPAMLALDAKGWGLLLYLSLAATVFGNAAWSWLLRHLPASTTGFTIFLNPPLTTASKWLLSLALPASFSFAIGPLEWVGGALAMAGVALAILERPVPMGSGPREAPRAADGSPPPAEP